MSSDLSAAVSVSAVIVSHDGERFLPRLLDALAASSVSPTDVVAVDTDSSDGSRSLLIDRLGESAVVDAPRDAGFGAAVSRGLSALPREGSEQAAWIWLLHDDCAPDVDTLRELLAVATSAARVAVVGPRIRAWPRAQRLLEVGVTISGTGHRETRLEAGEYDQGQHDEQRDVLAVSTAGMLVRRDVWDRLGGLDPRLPLFRDDIDFGWRVAKAGERVVFAPAAMLFHAEAAARGARRIDCTAARPHRGDRRAALYSLLVNCPAAAVPWQYVRLALGSLLRAIGYLLGKLPATALDEVLAAAGVLGRPDTIWRARRGRRAYSTAETSAWRPLLPRWWTPYANGVDSVLGLVTALLRERSSAVASSRRQLRSGRGDPTALETGPVADEAVSLPVGAGPLALVASHPILALTALLTVAAFVATRGLHGAGFLQGGALLPAPTSSSSWWGLYTESWHGVGLGSDLPTAPYVAVLAAAATLLAGKAWLVVDLLVLFAVPLAALSAYAAARAIMTSQLVCLWVAVTYGLLPALTGISTSGHLGTVVAITLLPWVVRAAAPLLTTSSTARWRSAAATGLTLSLLVAFAPVGWPMAAAATLAAAGFLAGTGRVARVPKLLFALSLPLLLLAPWSWRLVTTPSLLLTEAGRVVPGTTAMRDAWQLPFGRVDAAGAAPWWLAGGLLLAAIVALLRPDRLARVAGAWVVLALGLATVAVLSQQTVTVPGTDAEALVWLGFPTVVAQGAAIAAVAFAADGLGRVVRSGRFGWRQPVAAVTAVTAVVTPVLGLAWWTGVAPAGDLDRRAASDLPAYMTDAMMSEARQRVLVVRGDEQPMTYDVLFDDGRRLGQESVLDDPPSDSLTELVTDLVSRAEPRDVARLSDYGIAYVVLPRPISGSAVAELDAQPSLTRASSNTARMAAWQVSLPAGLVKLVDPGATRPATQSRLLPVVDRLVDTSVPAGSDSRVVLVAAADADGFEARLDGSSLNRRTTDTGVAFDLGAGSGTLEVATPTDRSRWLLVQGVALLVVAVLAAPGRRNRGEEESR